jgi:hypothetical protein
MAAPGFLANPVVVPMPPAAPDWANPAVLGINKRAARAPMLSHASVRSAVLHYGDRDQYEGGRTRLSGCEWDFRLYPSPFEVDPADWGKDGWVKASNQPRTAFPTSACST